MPPSSIVHQANEDQTHPSMMAWRVHEFGPPLTRFSGGGLTAGVLDLIDGMITGAQWEQPGYERF
jgi:hypothetical protein